MLTSNSLNLTLPSQYKINELIFINSGASYYTRLPVNEHAALLARNNHGKTSTLSAMKLFLLPEISFKNTEKKFGFRSGGKIYSDLDSYRFYFPSNESYIICHAENPKLQFCWVLYRTSNKVYERIAVPRSYDEIEHLFWRNKTNKNGGAGELQPDIATTTIRKQLLSKDIGGQLFTDKGTIGEAIYTRTSIQDDHTRFSLLPMTKKATPASIETVRSLLAMAFDLGNASTSSLPAAISSIIDGLGMSAVKSEGLPIDFDAQLDEWNELKQQDARIANIEANRPVFDAMSDSLTAFNTLKDTLLPEHAWLRSSVDVGVNRISLELQEAASKAESAKKKYEDHNRAHQAKNKALQEIKLGAKLLQKNIDSYKADIQTSSKSRAQLRPVLESDNPTDAEYLAYLDADIAACINDIKGLSNQVQAAAQLKELHIDIKAQESSISQVYEVIEEYEASEGLLDQLTPRAAFALDNLNKDFATLKGSLGVEQLATVDAFAGLFGSDGESMTFCDQKMKDTGCKVWDKAQTIAGLKDGLAKMEEQLDKDKQRESRLQESLELDDTERSEEIARHQDDLKELREQRNCISADDRTKERLSEEEEKLEEKLVRFEIENEEFGLSENVLLELRDRFDDLQEEPQRLSDEAAHFQECLNHIQMIEGASGGLLLVDPKEATLETSTLSDPITIKQRLDNLQSDIQVANQYKSEGQRHLLSLLDREVIKVSADDRYATSFTGEMFDSYFSQLEGLYDNLDQLKESYRERLNAHNNTAAASTQMVSNIRGIIESFTDNINQEISGYRVSNLERVKLKVKLDAQYISLVDSLSRMTTVENTLLSEEFYKQISSFQQRFYVRKTGKVNIAAIIQEIDYHYKINGEWEDKPQSNGTNSMVSAMLLALMFKRMVPEDLSLTIPVIFDEVGKLDEENLSEILRLVDDHDLTLFAANPENTGTIAEVLGVYHDLASYRVTDVGVIGNCEIIYYPGMEDRLEDAYEESLENEEAYSD